MMAHLRSIVFMIAAGILMHTALAAAPMLSSDSSQAKPRIAHSRYVLSVAFSPDGKTVASGSMDTTSKLWNVATGRQLSYLLGHSGDVTSVVFSPDGRTVASASADKTIYIWELATGRSLLTLTGHLSRVTSLSFSPNGKILASGSDD
jgi:WD40 repeat protein